MNSTKKFYSSQKFDYNKFLKENAKAAVDQFMKDMKIRKNRTYSAEDQAFLYNHALNNMTLHFYWSARISEDILRKRETNK